MARHRHARRIWRRGPRRRRGGDHDAGSRTLRRRLRGLLDHPHQYLRTAFDRQTWRGSPAARHGCPPSSAASRAPASASPSRTPGSTPRRSRPRRCDAATITSSTVRRSGPAPRSRRTRSCCSRARRRSRNARSRRTGCPCSTPIWIARSVEIREIGKDGPARRQFQSTVLRQSHRAGSIGALARKARAFATSSTASIPNVSSTPPRSIGMGRRALEKAVAYADQRVVFGRKIGQNQSIQHPLAECWSELYAADLMTMHAAELYDSGQPCGAQANAAKYLAADAGFQGLRSRDPHPRRHGLRHRISRRALFPRDGRDATRAGLARDDPVLHRRARTRPCPNPIEPRGRQRNDADVPDNPSVRTSSSAAISLWIWIDREERRNAINKQRHRRHREPRCASAARQSGYPLRSC